MKLRKKSENDKKVRKSTRCYAIHDGKVVTIKYKNKERFNGWYDLPGGKIEIGETADECAKREFYEETGLTITDLENCGNLILEYPTKISDYTIFYIKDYEGTINPLETDNDAEIIDIEKLLMFDNKFICTKLLEDKYLKKILNCEKMKIKMLINDKEEIVDVTDY